LLGALERGEVRAAEPDGAGWRVNGWVKQGILLGFRVGVDVPAHLPPLLHFRDRDLFGTWDPERAGRDVRIVPGGSAVRRGAYLAPGVVMMPPSYVNVGAWVGARTMIDSHVLVGSCAQIGRGVHLSAGVQIGGVLEPAGALPVIVEDEAFVGGGCGIYESARVGVRAVLAPGVVLTRALRLVDLVRECVHVADGAGVLTVPAEAVVVPGVRPAAGEFARREGIGLQTPVIVKYRDANTAAAVALEESLR
ncbi:MAG TPA: 2,3,4,5-tetrahydropyridine-2,6-dicarboxylate N-succinyltransferase, partial [Candidatus Polarisedimenticolaceae bacterium]|nr:2,3,4,5-tetrahydropyridine-2,6-dicarboxylate N-succinyltransferase [Candidatus Polarisedimenticolaceae bacterium]